MEERTLAQQSPEKTQYQPALQRRSPSRTSHNPLCVAFWRGLSSLKSSLVSVVSKFLLVTVCVAPTLLAACAGESSARTGISLQSTATVTATLPPQPLFGMALGSTRDEFTRKLGAPIERYGNPWYPVALSDGTTVYVGFFVEHTGSDGATHIAGFHVQGSGDTRWSDEQCATVARAFLPPDAKQVSHSTTFWGAQVGSYASSDLARTFPASEFKNVLGDRVAPGTFTTACPDGSPEDWDIRTGSI